MKALVTAASRHGATSEIASAIARTLHREGFESAVRDPGTVESVAGYDAVILGSAVYFGRWLRAAREFAVRFSQDLRLRPVWLFSSGPVGWPPRPGEEPAEVGQMAKVTGAREHRRFGGRIARDGLSLPERAVIGIARVHDRDDRDWREIDIWATTIALDLDEVTEHQTHGAAHGCLPPGAARRPG